MTTESQRKFKARVQRMFANLPSSSANERGVSREASAAVTVSPQVFYLFTGEKHRENQALREPAGRPRHLIRLVSTPRSGSCRVGALSGANANAENGDHGRCLSNAIRASCSQA